MEGSLIQVEPWPGLQRGTISLGDEIGGQIGRGASNVGEKAD